MAPAVYRKLADYHDAVESIRHGLAQAKEGFGPVRGLRHSRELTLLCSRILTQQPAFGGDDIAFPTFGLRTKARRLRWVTLNEQKWVILGERRGRISNTS